MWQFTKRHIVIYITTIVVSLLLFGLALYFFSADYRRLQQSGILGYPRSRHFLNAFNTRAKPPIPVSQADLIRTWMTFAYVNKAFNLPGDYLRNMLEITDRAYPNIAIRALAERQHLLPDAYLESVKEAIRQYPAIAPD